MQYWNAHYKDERHDTDIVIRNTEEEYGTNPLSFEIDGIAFHGTGLGDFRLVDEESYENVKEQFHILKWGGRNEEYGLTQPYGYDLQR